MVAPVAVRDRLAGAVSIPIVDTHIHLFDTARPQGDRESVVEGKRGDLGGRRIIKKKRKRPKPNPHVGMEGRRRARAHILRTSVAVRPRECADPADRPQRALILTSLFFFFKQKTAYEITR